MFSLLLAGALGARIQDPKDLYHVVRETIDEEPWVVPYSIGVAGTCLGLYLGVKMGKLTLHDASKVFIPGHVLTRMENTGVVALLPNVTKTSDMVLTLVPKG
jgi:hypothetical protein